jgi:hypothetical protein
MWSEMALSRCGPFTTEWKFVKTIVGDVEYSGYVKWDEGGYLLFAEVVGRTAPTVSAALTPKDHSL